MRGAAVAGAGPGKIGISWVPVRKGVYLCVHILWGYGKDILWRWLPPRDLQGACTAFLRMASLGGCRKSGLAKSCNCYKASCYSGRVYDISNAEQAPLLVAGV